MIRVFQMGGPFMIPLTLIVFVLAALTMVNAIRLARRTLPSGHAGDVSLRALPFWGVVAILVGFLGQVSGHYRILGVVIGAEAINPGMVMAGLRESLVPTITGLLICTLALLCWGALRAWQRRNERRAQAPPT